MNKVKGCAFSEALMSPTALAKNATAIEQYRPWLKQPHFRPAYSYGDWASTYTDPGTFVTVSLELISIGS